MKADYSDIVDRIDEDPLWFDHRGVPRYDSFHPKLLPNIYAQVAALYEISCQNCGELFCVSASWGTGDLLIDDEIKDPSYIVNLILSEGLSYGDPPWARPSGRCCPSGPTMTSNYVGPLQIWVREKHDWKNKFNKIQ